MSTNENPNTMTLDAGAVRLLIEQMSPPELSILRALLKDVKERGNTMSQATIDEMARHYADKAKQLAGTGGEP